MTEKTHILGTSIMLAPATSFSHSFLSFLWTSTCFLALGSLGLLLLIYFKRLLHERLHSFHKKIKSRLSDYLYASIKIPVPIKASDLPKLSNTEKRLLIPVALDILRNVTGSDKDHILNLLTEWKLHQYILSSLSVIPRGKKVQYLTLLGQLKGKNINQALEHYAQSTDTYIQIAALRGLSQRHTAPKLIQETLKHLTSIKETNTLLLTEVLSQFDSNAIPALQKLAMHATATEVRNACIITLGKMHALKAVPNLMTLLKDNNPDICAHTANALGQIGDPRASKPLAECLNHKHLGVRVQATQALSKLKYIPALKAMTTGLHDEEWWTRFRTAEAIYHMGTQGKALLRSMALEKSLAGHTCAQYLEEMEEPYA